MSSVFQETPSQLIRKHRNIYRFGGAWPQVLLWAVPWINVVVLTVLLVLVHGKTTATAGLLFDLPHSPIREGAAASLIAMLIPVAGENEAGAPDTLVFFSMTTASSPQTATKWMPWWSGCANVPRKTSGCCC